MKKFLPLVVMCLFAASALAQQSLGDIAREIRAKKRAGSPAVRLDDDTTSRKAGPEPTSAPSTTTAAATPPADAKSADDKSADAKPADDKSADAKPADDKSADAKPADANPADAAKEKEAAKKDSAETKKQKNEEIKKKIDAVKQEIAILQRELDVAQREGRLRAAAYYADAGTMLRDQTKFAEDSRKEQAEIDTKKEALASAQQKLADLQEEARRAGLPASTTE